MDRRATKNAGWSRAKVEAAVSWIDARTGARKLVVMICAERIPGGARAAYVFGSGLLFVFILQVITGVVLALYYTPTAETAHTSVAYITKQVAGGAFLRGLHSYGSSAMIVVLFLHFVQTFFYGSFKGRRELLWLSGAVLSLLVLSMGFTGYLLPWDQKAYFATSVGSNVAGQVPLIGDLLMRFLRGGQTIGTLTLSRFYVAHILLLPGAIFLFIGAHVLLFRKAGPAGPVHEHSVTPRLATETFYPRQVLLDMAFALLVIAVVCGLAYLRPVTLGPLANPADSHFLPRPEWYYLPLFEWLKFWEGPLVVIGVVAIPGLIATAFFLIPFLDRGLERKPWRRPVPALAVTIVITGMVYLGVRSSIEDNRGDTKAQLQRQRQEELAYTAAPFQPYSRDDQATLALATLAESSPVALGKGIFMEKGCSGCHGTTGSGSAIAPSLVGVRQRYGDQKLLTLMYQRNDRMRAAGMPAVDPATTDVNALLAYLGVLGTPASHVRATFRPRIDNQKAAVQSVGEAPPPHLIRASNPRGNGAEDSGDAVALGSAIFQERGCFACHGQEGKGALAPALAPLVAKLEDAELRELLRAPNKRMRAGGMPPIQASPKELGFLVAYLRSLRAPGGPSTAEPEHSKRMAPPAAVPDGAAPAHSLLVSLDTSAVRPAAQQIPQQLPDTVSDPGLKLFQSQGCAGCHGAGGQGTTLAPSLVGVTTRFPGPGLATLLRHPRPKMRAAGMPVPTLDDLEMSQLVAYLSSLTPNRSEEARTPVSMSPHPEVARTAALQQSISQLNSSRSVDPPRPASDPLIVRGHAVFVKHSCQTCHGDEGLHGTIAAPGLAGTASLLAAPTLEGLLRHHTERMKKGGMPLTNFRSNDMKAIVVYIHSLSTASEMAEGLKASSTEQR